MNLLKTERGNLKHLRIPSLQDQASKSLPLSLNLKILNGVAQAHRFAFQRIGIIS